VIGDLLVHKAEQELLVAEDPGDVKAPLEQLVLQVLLDQRGLQDQLDLLELLG